MKKYLEMFDEHLAEVMAAFKGDDHTLRSVLFEPEDDDDRFHSSFEIDLPRILTGDLEQFDVESSWIFFVVQNKRGNGHRCWTINPGNAEIFSNGTAILFGSADGKLQAFKSTKNRLHNANVKLWGGHVGCVNSLVRRIAAEEEQFRDPSSEIWTKPESATEYMQKMWITDTGYAQWLYTLPADSPPLRYSTSETLYSTFGYMVPVLNPLYNNETVTFNVRGLTSEITVDTAMQASFPRVRLEQVAATRYGRVKIHARDMYKLIRFKEIQDAVIMPEIRTMVQEMIEFTPWSRWGDALMFFRKQPNCCVHVAIISEMLGLSDRTILGFLGFDLFDHHQKNIRRMLNTDWIHGITYLTYNRDNGCYNSVRIDKTVVLFSRFLVQRETTTTTTSVENYRVEDRARARVTESIVGI
jgi:hypothetical protein